MTSTLHVFDHERYHFLPRPFQHRQDDVSLDVVRVVVASLLHEQIHDHLVSIAPPMMGLLLKLFVRGAHAIHQRSRMGQGYHSVEITVQ